MNEQILDQKLQALSRFPRLGPETVKTFGDIIRRLDDWSLMRINPLRFAQEHNLDAVTSIEFFVYASKVGLVDFSYEMLCPKCGGRERSHNMLDQIENNQFHCTNCNVSVPVTLDDQVQVSFTINPSIAPLNINIYADQQSYFRYYFSPDFQHSPETMAYFMAMSRGFVAIPPDEWGQITFRAEPNTVYRIMNMQIHAESYFHVGETTSDLPQIAEVEMLDQGFTPDRLDLAAGEVTLRIRNLSKSMTGMILSRIDFDEMYAISTAHPGTWQPYLTGKMLLNNQSFRELFRIQHLAPDLKLNIRSLTIMFTDLKNSTEIYSRAGDVVAYSLVQQHFDLLIDIVRRNSGSIVKTMGDAIMATFSTPEDGLCAALEMTKEIAKLSQGLTDQGYETGIKIGLNEGAVLAVNADERLDYFGQNVNVAARVQGLAQTGQIWLTETIFDHPTVSDILASNGYTTHKQSALLKGVGQATIVYECIPTSS